MTSFILGRKNSISVEGTLLVKCERYLFISGAQVMLRAVCGSSEAVKAS